MQIFQAVADYPWLEAAAFAVLLVAWIQAIIGDGLRVCSWLLGLILFTWSIACLLATVPSHAPGTPLLWGAAIVVGAAAITAWLEALGRA
jgi:hypothetical protein